MNWEPVIGLEVHVQLLTKTKMFCGCSTAVGNVPNTQVCPVCMALPGALPVPNRQAIEFAIRLGLAFGCSIRNRTKFDRKNYFYPDLPKGYQISQFDEPICENGKITIATETGPKEIRILRIHLEEDAGKSLHTGTDTTLVDLNRCGVPLLEIVSQPDVRTPQEAYLYLSEIKRTVEQLEISSGNLEEGSMRCDANVSLRANINADFGTRCEIKNINSLKYVSRAIEAEIERQSDILNNGGTIEQQTLTFDEKSGRNKSLRSKEESRDYRYFPEPDLVKFTVPDEWIAEVKNFIPMWKRDYDRRKSECDLSDSELDQLTQFPELGTYFDRVTEHLIALDIDRENRKKATRWVLNEAQAQFKLRNESPLTSRLSPEILAQIVVKVIKNEINNNTGKDLLERMHTETRSLNEIIATEGLSKVSDTGFVETIVRQVIENFSSQVEEYRSGKAKVFEFLLGQIMKLSRGKADPDTARKILKSALDQ